MECIQLVLYHRSGFFLDGGGGIRPGRLHNIQLAGECVKLEEEKNYTYILTCADGTFYCGWTNHLAERVRAHNEGRGAKYTRSRRPVRLSYWEVFATRQEAMRREWAIKQLTRAEKEALIAGQATN